jgi:biotin carboxylase
MRFPRCGRIIVEEFIDADTANFHGDGFVLDGNLIFCLLGDQLITSPATSLKPTGSIYPSFKSDELVFAAVSELTKMIKQSGYDYGGVNLEVRIDRKGDVYIMEIGPRNGGTLTPQAIAYATGFDMLAAVFNYFEGTEIDIPAGNITPRDLLCCSCAEKWCFGRH